MSKPSANTSAKKTIPLPHVLRINVTGDWGVGVVDENSKRNIILSTGGLVGCSALFFVSKKGRWLSHVMDSWLQPSSPESKMSVDTLSANLNQQAQYFKERTGSEIETVYICIDGSQGRGFGLQEKLVNWVKTDLGSAKLELRKGNDNWHMNNKCELKSGISSLPACLDYSQNLQQYHVNSMNIPGVWNRPFFQSPMWKMAGPIGSDGRPLFPAMQAAHATAGSAVNSAAAAANSASAAASAAAVVTTSLVPASTQPQAVMSTSAAAPMASTSTQPKPTSVSAADAAAAAASAAAAATTSFVPVSTQPQTVMPTSAAAPAAAANLAALQASLAASQSQHHHHTAAPAAAFRPSVSPKAAVGSAQDTPDTPGPGPAATPPAKPSGAKST